MTEDEDRSALIFRRYPDEMSWGYACPLREGEDPEQGFRRVLDHVLDLLPILGKPDCFFATGADGTRVDLRDLRDLSTTEWQRAVRAALPADPVLEVSGGLMLVLESADGTSHGYLVNHNGFSVEYTDDAEGAAEPFQEAIDVSLSIAFDVFDPPPQDASPALVEQSARNRPKLERFLTAVRDDFDAVFNFWDPDCVGPLGVLGPDESRGGFDED